MTSIVLSLPFDFRGELHQREVPNTPQGLLAASQDQGVAVLCSEVQELSRGRLCETIVNHDHRDAESRLLLRMRSQRAFIDGDSFFPRDGRSPKVVNYRVEKNAPRSTAEEQIFTHTHICPVVDKAVFSAFFVDGDRLCVEATASVEPVARPSLLRRIWRPLGLAAAIYFGIGAPLGWQ